MPLLNLQDEKFKKIGAKPMFFVLRQLYRIFLILPFRFVIFLCSLFDKKEISLQESKLKTSYCFLVSSVIYSREKKLVSYGGVRSIFTPEERANQTLETIASIRKYLPTAKIVLVEAGLKGDLLGKLLGKADQYVYVGDKKLVRLSCDSKIKSLGEAMMLLYALPKLKYCAGFYFKMSGRYCLNEEFRLSDWQHKAFVFRYFRDDYACTRLYGFDGSLLKTWKYILLNGLPFNLIDYPIENTLTKFISRKSLVLLPRLGLSGVGASSNENIRD
jgi:hypothetical protein